MDLGVSYFMNKDLGFFYFQFLAHMDFGEFETYSSQHIKDVKMVKIDSHSTNFHDQMKKMTKDKKSKWN